MLRTSMVLLYFFLNYIPALAQPGRLAVADISHEHSSWILGRRDDTTASLVGIYEPSGALAEKMASRYKLDPSLFYNDLGQMLDAVMPDGVMAFGSTYEHLKVVEAAVPRKIPEMVEKPLATTLVDAERISALSRQYGVPLLTNYETSWYLVTDRVHALTRDTTFMGLIRKVVVHDGYQGSREFGVSLEFFDWVTDPVLNGGGALTDFGCYGTNLMIHSNILPMSFGVG